MCDSVTAWQQYRRAGKPALFAALAFLLAGCAAADAPMPFITTPEPETTATTPAATEAPAATHGAAPAQAPAHAGAAANGSAAASHTPGPHSPVRQDLPFPSFATPAAAGAKPVLTDAEKTKMQSDLEALAKSRETKMRQDIEQAQ